MYSWDEIEHIRQIQKEQTKKDSCQGQQKERKSMTRADSFLMEIVEVSKRHGLSLAHEDREGGFIVEPFRQENIKWLLNAEQEIEGTEDAPAHE